jgi:hypothetical protein
MKKMGPTPTEIEALRQHVKHYRFDNQDSPIPGQLAASDRALKAIAELSLSERQLNKLLLSCIQSVLDFQSFDARLAQISAVLRKSPALHRSIDDLRQLVREVSAPPPDLLSASIYVSREENEWLLRALSELQHIVDYRAKVARQTRGRIGATRKSSNKNAAENAGIGWLGASIKKITGRPHVRQACALAEILFGIREVREDRLIGASKNVEADWALVT